jgi:hypothetical protein
MIKIIPNISTYTNFTMSINHIYLFLSTSCLAFFNEPVRHLLLLLLLYKYNNNINI